jgi:hypothetical protein
MSCKSVLALSLVGALVMLPTGSAWPDPYPFPAPVCPRVSPAHSPERGTAVAAGLGLDDHDKDHTRASRCGDLSRPIIKVNDPTLREKAVASLPKVPGLLTPPSAPLANPMNEAPEPLTQPEPEQPRTHTLTIYNGAQVVRRTFIWQNGSWRSCGDCNTYDVFFRDCPRSPWHFYGTYSSPRRAEEIACSLRASGNPASVCKRQCRLLGNGTVSVPPWPSPGGCGGKR